MKYKRIQNLISLVAVLLTVAGLVISIGHYMDDSSVGKILVVSGLGLLLLMRLVDARYIE
ncbi:hypothetical protein [Pontibacter roseus]|uniref:hypothetical protein n=1 Tax=Pontibacter roseus TaxID=336989 RepID=UPI0003743F89|nr:hypothetical protein [Pontibacter roseus]